MSLYIGLMSGTSMDGIDAALVDLPQNTLVKGLTLAYGDETKRLLDMTLGGEPLSVARWCQLNTYVGREFARVVDVLLREADVRPQAVSAIGSHGQTIGHDALANPPYTLQMGCAHTIAATTDIPVVADFRTRDLVLGGVGAPFAPIYHQALFGQSNEPVVAVNVGGIANLSRIHPDKPVVGYDTGPGNCLLDAWAEVHLHQPYDKDGVWGAGGQVLPDLLRRLLQDEYFSMNYPKSIGKEHFSLSWLERHLDEGMSAQDVQATLIALTANTIATSVSECAPGVKHVILCGGGVHNLALLRQLSEYLPNSRIESSAAVGVDPDYLEAMMFAWLAEKAMTNTPLDLTHITGARCPAVLGVIYRENQAPLSSLRGRARGNEG